MLRVLHFLDQIAMNNEAVLLMEEGDGDVQRDYDHALGLPDGYFGPAEWRLLHRVTAIQVKR